jgi:hypothetical protein
MGPQGIPSIVAIVVGVAALGMAALLMVVRLTRRDRDGKQSPTMLPANSRVYAAVAMLLGIGLAVFLTMAARVR